MRHKATLKFFMEKLMLKSLSPSKWPIIFANGLHDRLKFVFSNTNKSGNSYMNFHSIGHSL